MLRNSLANPSEGSFSILGKLWYMLFMKAKNKVMQWLHQISLVAIYCDSFLDNECFNYSQQLPWGPLEGLVWNLHNSKESLQTTKCHFLNAVCINIQVVRPEWTHEYSFSCNSTLKHKAVSGHGSCQREISSLWSLIYLFYLHVNLRTKCRILLVELQNSFSLSSSFCLLNLWTW